MAGNVQHPRMLRGLGKLQVSVQRSSCPQKNMLLQPPKRGDKAPAGTWHCLCPPKLWHSDSHHRERQLWNPYQEQENEPLGVNLFRKCTSAVACYIEIQHSKLLAILLITSTQNLILYRAETISFSTLSSGHTCYHFLFLSGSHLHYFQTADWRTHRGDLCSLADRDPPKLPGVPQRWGNTAEQKAGAGPGCCPSSKLPNNSTQHLCTKGRTWNIDFHPQIFHIPGILSFTNNFRSYKPLFYNLQHKGIILF